MPSSRSPSAAADIGILTRQDDVPADYDPADPAAAPDDDRPSCSRWDVLRALAGARDGGVRGGVSASDRADGTTASPALPAAPDLRVEGVGDVSLPVVAGDARADAIEACAARCDGSRGGGVHRIDPGRVRIRNPAWGAALERVATTAGYKLGFQPARLTAELDSELV